MSIAGTPSKRATLANEIVRLALIYFGVTLAELRATGRHRAKARRRQLLTILLIDKNIPHSYISETLGVDPSYPSKIASRHGDTIRNSDLYYDIKESINDAFAC